MSCSYDSLAKYDERLIKFFIEAGDSDDQIRHHIKSLSFVSNPQFYSIATLNLLSYLFVLYIATKNLQDPTDKNSIIPDTLMKKYFSDELERIMLKSTLGKIDCLPPTNKIKIEQIRILCCMLMRDPQQETPSDKKFLSDDENVKIVIADAKILKSEMCELIFKSWNKQNLVTK